MTTGTTAAPAQDTAKETAPAKTAKATKAQETATSTDEALKDIQYIGAATQRTITTENWLELGLEHEEVEWNLANGFRVPEEELSREAVAYCLKKDGRFQRVDALVEDDDEDESAASA